MRELPHTRGCFVCGEANPAGLKLRFETDGNIVRTKFVPREEHAGFREVVHGGLIATVLDEIMVWACAVHTRRFGFCAELNVRFVHPLRPGDEVLVSGELAANRKGRIFEAKSEMRTAAGLVLATGTGKYLPLKPAETERFIADFVREGGADFSLTGLTNPPSNETNQ